MRVRVLLINGLLSPRRIIFMTHLLAPSSLFHFVFLIIIFGSMRMYIPVRTTSTDYLPAWTVFFHPLRKPSCSGKAACLPGYFVL